MKRIYKEVSAVEYEQQKEGKKRLKEARGAITTLLPRKPWSRDLCNELRDETGIGLATIKKLLGGELYERKQCEMICERTYWYHLDGKRTKIPDDVKEDATEKLATWSERSKAKREKFKRKAANKRENRNAFEDKRRKLMAKSKVKESMSPVGKSGRPVLSLKRCPL